jgi:YHS domain-containing protein
MPVQAEDILQTTCPVMGNEIDKEVYTDLHGVRVYFCCPPCIEKFRNNPEEYVANLPEAIQDQLKAAMQEVGHD